MLLAAVKRGLDSVRHMTKLIADLRNPAFVTHSLTDILRARMLAITCGYENVGDLDHPDALSVNLQIALVSNLGLWTKLLQPKIEVPMREDRADLKLPVGARNGLLIVTPFWFLVLWLLVR